MTYSGSEEVCSISNQGDLSQKEQLRNAEKQEFTLDFAAAANYDVSLAKPDSSWVTWTSNSGQINTFSLEAELLYAGLNNKNCLKTCTEKGFVGKHPSC